MVLESNHLLLRARELIDAGFSVIPVMGKKPVINWASYQTELPDGGEYHWSVDNYDGLGVICGSVSGDLECMDFDDPAAWEQFKQFAPADLVDRCYWQTTPSGGCHLVYRCEGEVGGNAKLARGAQGQVRIETRGEGGYFLVPPSPGYSGVPYDGEYSGDWNIYNTPTLSTSERETLHRYARIFDEYTTQIQGQPDKSKGGGEGPGSDYNERGDVRPILLKHGWSDVGTRADGVELWERPGKDEHSVSATYGIGGSRLFYVFSTNALPFQADTPYTQFAVYSLLECNGDFVRAARTLAAQGFGRHEEVAWEYPAPIVQIARPEFDITIYPEWLQRFLCEIRDSLEVPIDMPAMLVLGCIAACISKRVTISPKEDWQEPTNLFITVPMPPSTTKSGTLKILSTPITEYEKQVNKESRVRRQVAEGKRKALQKQIDKATEEYATTTTDEERVLAEEKLVQLYEELNELSGQGDLCLVVKDITPEMLVKKLAENGGKLAVIDDEAGLFGMMAGRYSSGSTNIDVYLTGYSGGDLRVSRISREDDVVENPALTLVLSVQPGAMEGLTLSSEFRDRGLLARFLIVYPHDNVGERECANRVVSRASKQIYENVIHGLLSMRGELNLVYSKEAEKYFWDEVRRIEKRLGPGGDLYDLRDWGGKLRGAIARLSAILHTLSIDIHADNPDNVVSLVTLRKAWGLSEYLIAHAKFSFAEMGYDLSVRRARRIIAWLERKRVDRVSKRDLYRDMSTVFPKAHDADEPLKLLVERGYLAHEGDWKKRSENYLVNPLLYERKKSGTSEG